MFNLAALAVGASALFQAHQAVEPAVANYFGIDPAEYARRADRIDPVFAYNERAFDEAVFDRRFVWAEYSRNRSVLVVFAAPCDALRYATPVPGRATGTFVYAGRRCRTDGLYMVPDEAAGRALALQILVDEARRGGERLPASDVEAALTLISRAQSEN